VPGNQAGKRLDKPLRLGIRLEPVQDRAGHGPVGNLSQPACFFFVMGTTFGPRV
jgi:hypothetical protein